MISPQSFRLKEALSRFQTQLEREIDAGDTLRTHHWAEEVRQAFDALVIVVNDRRQRIHSKLFSAITDQDCSRRHQIQELEDVDARIRELVDIVKSQLIVLSMQTSSEVEARIENQSFDDELVLQVADRGMELIQWIRDHEESVTSWFAESFAAGA